jgi:DNA-binding beta-propeller fold protein YncE
MRYLRVIKLISIVICCVSILSLLLIVGCVSSQQETFSSAIQTHEYEPVWPPPPEKARIKYINSISGLSDVGYKKAWLGMLMDNIFGKEDQTVLFLRPYGIFASMDRLYITDPGLHVLHVMDLSKKEYFKIMGTPSSELVSPIGVTVDNNGYIYLTDSVLKKVFVFDKSGKYIKEIGSSEIFSRPTGITNEGDRIYIVDTLNHCIKVFNKDSGNFLFSFGKRGVKEGDFNYPTHICSDRDSFLYVSDSLNFRVQIFNKDGIFIASFGKPGDNIGSFANPKGIAVDPDGNIYVVDAKFDNVQIFNRQGQLLLVFGSTGHGPGNMLLPSGIYIDSHGKIYISDSFNNRIQILQYLSDKQ